MKLKHCDEIDWLELPKIESPHVARTWVESHVRVIGPEALSVAGDVIPSGPAIGRAGLDILSDSCLLSHVENAEIVLVHDLGSEPLCPAVRRSDGQDGEAWQLDSFLNNEAQFNLQRMLARAIESRGNLAPGIIAEETQKPASERAEREDSSPDAKLKLVYPDNAQHKQYVNLEDNDLDEGMNLRLRVEIENAKPGQRVHWKVTAGQNNSKRTKPKIGLSTRKGANLDELVKGVATCSSKVRRGKSQVYLVCGVAGGDEFTIEVGLAEGSYTESVKVITWRKLWYEILCPDFTVLSQGQDENGDPILDYPPQMKTRLTDRAKTAFVEFIPYKTHTFTEAEAPEGSVFKSEQLGYPAGGKGYVLTDHTFKKYPKNFDKGRSPRSVHIKLCNRNFFYESHSMQPVRAVYTLNAKSFTIDVMQRYSGYFLPLSAEDGKPAIKHFEWRALIDPVANPKHPAVANGSARTGKLDPEQDIFFTSVTEFDIRLPDSDPAAPGNLVGASVTPTQCPIEVSIEFEKAAEGLGLAGSGPQKGELLSFYNAQAKEASIDVLLHEIGHIAGLTTYRWRYRPPVGLDYPLTVAAGGNVYVRKGHSGSHCAHGLSNAQKSQPSFRGAGGTCIMFGENGGKDPSGATQGFCDECKTYFRARELDNLERNWNVGKVEAFSSSPGDTVQTLTIYDRRGGTQTVTLDGTTPVGFGAPIDMYAAQLSQAASGDVNLREPGGATLATIPAGSLVVQA